MFTLYIIYNEYKKRIIIYKKNIKLLTAIHHGIQEAGVFAVVGVPGTGGGGGGSLAPGTLLSRERRPGPRLPPRQGSRHAGRLPKVSITLSTHNLFNIILKCLL